MLVTKSYSAGPKTIYNFAFISAIALHMVTLFLWFIANGKALDYLKKNILTH